MRYSRGYSRQKNSCRRQRGGGNPGSCSCLLPPLLPHGESHWEDLHLGEGLLEWKPIPAGGMVVLLQLINQKGGRLQLSHLVPNREHYTREPPEVVSPLLKKGKIKHHSPLPSSYPTPPTSLAYCLTLILCCWFLSRVLFIF